MKLSEAIRLGSLILKPVCGRYLTPYGGCALGMAVAAKGGTYNRPDAFCENEWNTFLYQKHGLSKLPCGCENKETSMQEGGVFRSTRYLLLGHYRSLIVHLFNYHVCTVKDWTIDKLCEWVASVEPQEAPIPETAQKETPAQTPTVTAGSSSNMLYQLPSTATPQH